MDFFTTYLKIWKQWRSLRGNNERISPGAVPWADSPCSGCFWEGPAAGLTAPHSLALLRPSELPPQGTAAWGTLASPPRPAHRYGLRWSFFSSYTDTNLNKNPLRLRWTKPAASLRGDVTVTAAGLAALGLTAAAQSPTGVVVPRPPRLQEPPENYSSQQTSRPAVPSGSGPCGGKRGASWYM